MISDSNDNKSDDDFKPVEEKFSKYSSAASAARLVSKHSLSTKKAAIVCKSLKENGVDIASPTQVGVWKHVIKDAERKKVNIKAILQSETFCLHFDGKVILKTEYQVVCLQNENRIINLKILTCKNGSSSSFRTGWFFGRFLKRQALLFKKNKKKTYSKFIKYFRFYLFKKQLKLYII